MSTALLVLTIIGIIVLCFLLIAILYGIALIRRSNIVMKKIDYLVEDVTYKSESLSVAVEAINKISNYILTFDVLTKKSYKALVKLLSENRNYIYKIFEKLRTNEQTSTTKPKPKTSKTKTSKTKTSKTIDNKTKTSTKTTEIKK